MTPADWIEHRRGDRELVGWIVPSGELFHAIDLLGRPRTVEPVDWLDAEELLEQLGIGYLADRYLYTERNAERFVRIGEVSVSGVTVIDDDFGAASAIPVDAASGPARFHLPFPVPTDLLRSIP